MNIRTDKIWINGSFVDWENASTHILTHGLHYGSGAFDGIRFYATEKGTAIFRLTDHMKRFEKSCSFLKKIPYSAKELCSVAKELVRINGLQEGYIRPLFFIGCEKMGMNINSMPIVVTVSCWSWGTYLGEEALKKGVKCKIAKWRRINGNALPSGAKLSGKYVNSILAKMEAVNAGFDESIMLNETGDIAEGPGENIFIVKDKKVITPDEKSNILMGITRDSVLKIAKDAGYRTEERQVTVKEMLEADEAFFTGTAAELTPISKIDNKKIGSGVRGPVTEVLQKAFFDAVHGRNKKYEKWLEFV